MRNEFSGIDAGSMREYARARAALLVKTRQHRQQDAPPLDDWRGLLGHVFSAYVRPPYAPYHVEFWDWVMSITADATPRPFVTIWPRRAGKSTNSEVAAAVLGALHKRRFVLFVSATQDQANDHVQNIAALLESETFAKSFPATARRKIGKYGHSKAWRQNRLRTADGFIVHAIGLDTAARGVKIEGDRPDCIICDDLDELLDTPLTTQKKIDTLTKSILPTGGDNPAVVFAQNLIIANGIAGRLVDGRADFLLDRIVSGPHPAIEGLQYETLSDGRTVITGGESTWAARSKADLQEEINRVGLTAFLAEFQHLVQNLTRAMYAKVVFQQCDRSEVPALFDLQVWVDPAVSDTDQSDSQGIQLDGITSSGKLYRFFSWEDRTSPQTAIRLAILKGREYGVSCIGIETDQGGDTWESVYELAWRELVEEGAIGPHEQRLEFRQAKAGGRGSKMYRNGLMLAAYERGEIIHVRGTHDILERALRRFGIEKPFDLADACLIAGTLIETETGFVPIEEIRIGDSVMTRSGLQRVTESGMTATSAPVFRVTFADGRTLTGTGNHPIWTHEFGWIPLSDCHGLHGMMRPCPTRCIQKRTNRSKSPITVESIVDIQPRRNEHTGFTTSRPDRTPAHSKHFTGKYGSITTVRFRSARTFTTAIPIHSTTIRKISFVSRSKSIEPNTWKRHSEIPTPAALTLTEFDRSRPHGTEPKRGKHGTKSTPRNHGKVAPISSVRVKCAEISFKRAIRRGLVFAQQNAETERSKHCRAILLTTDAKNAESRFRRRDIENAAFARSRVETVLSIGTASVYNLSVENTPEYFANGALVHNCYWSWDGLSNPPESEGGSVDYTQAPPDTRARGPWGRV